MNDHQFSLFKFRTINKRLIESMVNQTLYFARPDTLNDPFDCRIDLEKACRRATMSATGDRRDFLSRLLATPDFFSNWTNIFEAMGVCCFSRTIQETLLWSHYADEHRGLCLEYRFRGLSLLGDITTAQNVEYLDDPLVPWLSNDAPIEMNQFIDELVRRYLRIKSPAWSYEQESRIIRQNHGTFKFKEVLVTEICFGLRTPKADIDLVVEVARSYCQGVKFSKMISDKTEFRFVKESL